MISSDFNKFPHGYRWTAIDPDGTLWAFHDKPEFVPYQWIPGKNDTHTAKILVLGLGIKLTRKQARDSMQAI